MQNLPIKKKSWKLSDIKEGKRHHCDHQARCISETFCVNPDLCNRRTLRSTKRKRFAESGVVTRCQARKQEREEEGEGD